MKMLDIAKRHNDINFRWLLKYVFAGRKLPSYFCQWLYYTTFKIMILFNIGV